MLDLDALARDALAEVGGVGAQVALLHRGALDVGVAGLAHVGTGQAVRPDTIFQVGSTTKLHTALLVLQLAEEGRIDLDVPVVEQLPGWRLSTPEATATCLPRHLLAMTSGIDFGPYTDTGRGDDAVRRWMDVVAELPVQHVPGEGFGYTNASTVVSGRLVEHVTGSTWDRALAERVLEPLELRDSLTLPEDCLTRSVAVGHDGDGAPLRQWALSRGLGPAGSTLCATAADLVGLAGRFLRGDALATTMTTPQVELPRSLIGDQWGLGPYGERWGSSELWGHTGSNVAGFSWLLWSAEHDLAVAVTCNQVPSGLRFGRLVQDAVLGSLAGLTRPPRPVVDDTIAVDPTRLVGRYAMSGVDLHITVGDDGLRLDDGRRDRRLRPTGPDAFVLVDPQTGAQDQRGLAFVVPPEGPATHVVDGFACLRRISDLRPAWPAARR